MEDDWIDYYSEISNIENYFDNFDQCKHDNGFIYRKFQFWKLHFKRLKDENSKLLNFYNNPEYSKIAQEIEKELYAQMEKYDEPLKKTAILK